jgi:alpha-beta hydrolase superfamily lysophospholipase
MSVIVALLAISTSALASPPGTFTVSSWDTVIDGGEAGSVWFKLHYPAVSADYGADADPSGGPFPVVAFMHGYLGSAWMYSDAADTLASMGAVVVNLDIETGLTIDTTRMARGTRAMLWWVDDNSRDPEHWLAGMSDGGDWAVGGHSMGGVALA